MSYYFELAFHIVYIKHFTIRNCVFFFQKFIESNEEILLILDFMLVGCHSPRSKFFIFITFVYFLCFFFGSFMKLS